MTNEEILTKAIEKAIANGYRPEGYDRPTHGIEVTRSEDAAYDSVVLYYNLSRAVLDSHPYDIIFDHDFAKALWGEQWLPARAGWQEHLKHMVLAGNPIKYLGEHI